MCGHKPPTTQTANGATEHTNDTGKASPAVFVVSPVANSVVRPIVCARPAAEKGCGRWKCVATTADDPTANGSTEHTNDTGNASPAVFVVSSVANSVVRPIVCALSHSAGRRQNWHMQAVGTVRVALLAAFMFPGGEARAQRQDTTRLDTVAVTAKRPSIAPRISCVRGRAREVGRRGLHLSRGDREGGTRRGCCGLVLIWTRTGERE